MPLKELLRGTLPEGLARPDGVAGEFPGLESSVERWDMGGDGLDLVELFGVRALSAFDMGVELPGAGWREEEA